MGESMETKQSVALLGLGTMGRGMAMNLLKSGFQLTVWNRTPARAEALAEMGATVAKTPALAAEGVDVVFAMLSDDDASRAAWLGKEGALVAMGSGAIVVESSTLSPQWIAELATEAANRDLRMVEAPVTGSRVQAEAGQLNFLVGADEAVMNAVAPVLRCMGNEIVHLGPIGSGAQLKLINNFLCAVQATSFAEALRWIERTGLQRDAALGFLLRGAPGSKILSAMAERMTKGKYEVNFLLRLMEKDLRYAHAAASELGIELSMSSPAEALFRAAREQGLGEKDMSAVVEAVRADGRQL